MKERKEREGKEKLLKKFSKVGAYVPEDPNLCTGEYGQLLDPQPAVVHVLRTLEPPRIKNRNEHSPALVRDCCRYRIICDVMSLLCTALTKIYVSI